MSRRPFRFLKTARSHPFIAAAGLLVLLALAAGIYALAARPHPYTFTMTTQFLPVLPPHVHGPGESDTDPGHAVDLDSPYYIAPADMWITSVTYTANNAPDALIHHVTLMNMSEAGQFCEREPLVIISLDGQNDKTNTYPSPYGIFVPKGSHLLLRAEFHNPEYPEGPGGTYDNVSASMKITAVAAAGRSKSLIPIYLALTDEVNCHYIDFTVPPKTIGFIMKPKQFPTTTTGAYTFPEDGKILIHGAHVHPWDGGKNVKLYINGILRFTYTPEHVGPEIWQWVMRTSYQPIDVHKGDRLTLTSEYDNPLTVPVRGAMGIQMFGWHPYPACGNAFTRFLRKFALYECTP